MALKFYSSLDLNKNELQNAVVQNLGNAPSNPAEGQLYYDSTPGDKEAYVYNGTSWVSMSGGGGDITGVTAGTGLNGGGAAGSVTLNVDAAQSGITSVANAALKIGRDQHNLIDFATADDKIYFRAADANQIVLTDGALLPVTDDDVDLGSSSLEFKNAFFDGTVTSDAFAGPLTGNVTGNASGSSGTVTSIGNLTGEVLSTNRATVIADNVVDEANLKVSNAPSNGSYLTAQSGNTGGLT